jgi:opacity protein-like surface antigen
MKGNFMKKSFIIILFAVAAATANAQFFAGLNGKFGTGKYPSWDMDTRWKCVGINAGYEFVKHIPVSIGVEYAVLKATDASFSPLICNAKFVRIPVTAGYCHYFGRIRLFAGAGVFASFGKRNRDNLNFYIPSATDIYYSPSHLDKIDPHVGYTLQGGAGYRIMDKLLLSLSFEYNRPFKETIDAEFGTWPSYRFAGATLGASWYF